MLIVWPGSQSIDDGLVILLFLAAGFALTTLVFRIALKRARQDGEKDQAEE
ncbi:MAG: hypothetical protein KDJ47_17560 [Hyphomicrobiaceae bacterium]|nr:hypothetical protein [Hyphomicrobiaceae bacterium]